MMLAKSKKLAAMAALAALFFFVEIIVGYLTGSVALIADSFHILSDVIALLISLFATRLATSNSSSPIRSFGWQRGEVLGALVNSVFLLALCLSIFIEAIQRFFISDSINQPFLVFLVGLLGLFINIIGLFLFGGHDHHHSHNHSSENHVFKHQKNHSKQSLFMFPSSSEKTSDPIVENDLVMPSRSSLPDNTPARSPFKALVHRINETANDLKDASISQSDCYSIHPSIKTNSVHVIDMSCMQSQPSKSTSVADAAAGVPPHSPPSSSTKKPHRDMNTHGVFLHVLGDALGSIAVIITALLNLFLPTSYNNAMNSPFITDKSNFSKNGEDYSKNHWVVNMDPAISVMISGLIVYMTVPLFRSSSYIVLQSLPQKFPVTVIESKILGLPYVVSLHELHIWQLSEGKFVASVHILLDMRSEDDAYDEKEGVKGGKDMWMEKALLVEDGTSRYVRISEAIRQVMHEFGVHSTTIQPEFLVEKGDVDEGCQTRCVSPTCVEQQCCSGLK